MLFTHVNFITSSKLFHYTLGKQITLTFYFLYGQNNTTKFGVPGFFGCSGVFWRIPVFLGLVHATRERPSLADSTTLTYA